MEYHDTKYENGVNLKELVPHGEEIKDNKKENYDSPSSSTSIVTCFLIFIIIFISILAYFLYLKFLDGKKIQSSKLSLFQ